MNELPYLTIQIVVQAPVMIVLVVGLALFAVRRRTITGRASSLGIGGCVTLLVATMANIAWLASVPWLLDSRDLDTSDFATISIALGLVLTLVHAAGLTLIICAVLASRRQPGTPSLPIARDGSAQAPQYRAP